MKQGILLIVFSILFLLPFPTQAQFARMDSLIIQENGQILSSPFAGGLNQPQFSSFDLNGDSLMDLVVFDRTGNKISTYLNIGSPGQIGFIYAPAYQDLFPALFNWALFRDYNCDGKMDIFTGAQGGNDIRVFENVSNGTIDFQLAISTLQADGIDIFAPATDIPAIADIDSDGDLDILGFDSGGFFVQFFENTGGCNSLDFTLNTSCWGQFQEDPFTNDIYLNTACKTDERGESGGLHSGSTLAVIDIDRDSAMELLLGDINFNNLVYLHNGGTAVIAEMDMVEPQYPDNSIPVSIFLFPAAYAVDVNNDSLQDLLVAPNATNISANFNASWYYQNTGSSTQYQFTHQQTNFLQDEMVDCGSNSHPVFFDYNADGLLDIVIGNLRYKDSQGNEMTALTLYENTGTADSAAFSLITRDYLGISSLFNPPILAASPAFGDLDEDGDMDLLLGDLEGEVHFFRNEAGSGNPASFVLANAAYAGIDVGQNASPQIIDLNRDGRPDLLIGEKSGNLNFFPNSGSIGQPDYSSGSTNTFGGVDVSPQCCGGFSTPHIFENENGIYELLVGTEKGGLYWYENIENNLGGTFSIKSDSFGLIAEGIRTAPFSADLDGDMRREWVIGNGRGGIAIYEDTSRISVGLNMDLFQPSLVRLLDHPGKRPILVFDESIPTIPNITVFSLQGSMIPHVAQQIDSHHISIQVPNKAPGLYLIRLNWSDAPPSVLKWRIP